MGAAGELDQGLVVRCAGEGALRGGDERGRVDLVGRSRVLLADQGRARGPRSQAAILSVVETLGLDGELAVLPR